MRFNSSPLDLLGTRVRRKIIRFLVRHEAEMSEREMAALVGASHMTVNRVLRELSEWNLVHQVSIGKAHAWKVHRGSYVSFRQGCKI